jgi:putative transposase
MRKDLLATGETYHVFTRSIADYKVFNNQGEFKRMRQLIKYYSVDTEIKFSDFMSLKLVNNIGFEKGFETLLKDNKPLVRIIAYCLMPTHIHLVLKQLVLNGLSKYIKVILDSYTRSFNTVHKRKGPLWESRFNNVLVRTDEQLLHLTRYVHLNPVTAYLVKKPEDWLFSSHKEYLLDANKNQLETICQFDNILEIKPSLYRKFVNDRISYQRELAKIKNLLLD